MELQSAKSSYQGGSSLSAADNSRQLDASKAIAAKLLKTEPSELRNNDVLPSPSSNISAVVSKLVTGPQASVAAYSELVANAGDTSPVAPQSRAPNMTTVSASHQPFDLQLNLSENLRQDNQREIAHLDVVRQLSAIDRKVVAHEQARATIGGSYALISGFDVSSRPDGKLYATSGEVAIDTSPIENDPRATLEKAQVIIRAALSVADPSSADRQIAAEAKSMALHALSQIGVQGDIASTQQEPSKVAQVQAQVEQQQLERKEYLAEQELKQARQERNEAQLQSRENSTDASIEVLREYNVQINEIQDTLRRLNQQLVGSGAFEKLFPEGALIDQNV